MSAKVTNSIKDAALVIQQGGVVICPSEGVYGISCSLFNEDAIKRVIKIKERDIAKGLIIVDSSLDTLKTYLDEKRVDDKSKALLKKYWPGPHTFVLPVVKTFNSTALRENHTVAIRITANEYLSALCTMAKTPMISTSANISGLSATSSLDNLDKRLYQRVDLILDLPCGGQK